DEEPLVTRRPLPELEPEPRPEPVPPPLSRPGRVGGLQPRPLGLPPNLPSYVTVETASPAQRSSTPATGLGPRILPQQPPAAAFPLDEPVPGGRHDLEADSPIDPTEELARLQARLAPPSFPPPGEAPPGAGGDPGEWVPLRSSWQPSAQTWKPLAERW